MTMHIHFLKQHDDNKPGTHKFVERTLGRRLCDNGVALPFITYEAQRLENLAAERVKKLTVQTAKEEAVKEVAAKADVEEEEDKKPPKRGYKRPEKAVKIEK